MSVLLSNETWDDNKSYRVKSKNGNWLKKSWLTRAKSILFGDGTDITNNAENNLGAIKGLTTSTNVTDHGYVVDATVVSDLNSKITALTANGAITEVQIVDALPADAASHPTTFYWVKG